MYLFMMRYVKKFVIFLDLANLTPKRYENVQFGLLQHPIKYYLDQFGSVQENESNEFCFSLTLWHPGKVTITDSISEL